MSCCDGFRLTAPSECSMRSKARIDALFEDSHSMCSSSIPGGGGWCASLAANVATSSCADEDQQRRVNSAVQARIEAMFASVEAENVAPGECAAAVLPVKYMGAAPVGGRVASVRGLQEPLRQLLEHIDDSVSAELEVSRRGLTFRTSELHEKNNPFRRIAVWSALKLQIRRRHNSLSEPVHAFVPLVAEERVTNASTTNSEDRHADLYRTMRGLAKDAEDYPPIFAVVMRRPGAARLLECHAFACRCEEDAIAAAATLYRALLADLDATTRRPRQRNGLGCASLASVVSSAPDTSTVLGPKRTEAHRPKLPPPPLPPPLPPSHRRPVRPPRAKKSSTSSGASTGNKQSSPSSSTSVDINEETPDSKKVNAEVKAEDVLEDRSRRLDLSNGSNYLERGPDNNSSLASSHLQQTSEERRMNAKNKIYGSRVSHCQASTGEVPVIEKICEERKPRDPHVSNTYDENEKSSSDHVIERSGSYGINCCTENSLYESSRIYAEVRTAGSKPWFVHRQPTPSLESTNELSCARRNASYEDLAQEELRRRRIAARHRDHFRDAEKIYSLGSHEEYTSTGNRSDRVYDTTHTTRQIPAKPKYDEPDPLTSSSRHPGRVSTLDRPLRKDILEPQQQQRRRSRAGSEPPNSRTETAAAAAAALLRRSQSELDLDRGDLMTRVELPRHGSFLKPGSVRKRDGLEGGGAGTPLGFTELFDEFRNQEGLTSVDDILDAIIDPEGMSFNDLKPLYKEFLLKLAATLTQDELYERSASIMKRRRRPQRRRSNRGGGGRACLLRRAIKRSVSRLRSSGSAPTEFTSVVYPARRFNNDRGSFGSSSSCDATRSAHTEPSGHHHRTSKVLVGKLGRRRSTKRFPSSKTRVGHTTSEDSDTCRRMSRTATTANRSSSGYVSCSECSYDSESCTCVSADKCYCSLSRKTPDGPTTALCICDTDSCSESNKCYCSRRRMGTGPRQPSILEQLRQKGILPSESTLSRAASPDRTNRNLPTSKSLEYLKVHPSSVRGSNENLALDYDMFSPGGYRTSQCSSGSEKVLVVSARDPQGRLIYVGGTERNGLDDKGLTLGHCQGDRRCRGTTGDSTTNGHHEALSIKKSAEIAAVFAGAGHTKIGRRISSTSSMRSSVSLEAGLGYLP